jgi:hypothetical protein
MMSAPAWMAVASMISAGASVYAATRKPKSPGQKPEAPVPDDEQARIAAERERRRRYAGGRASTVLQGPGTSNVLG